MSWTARSLTRAAALKGWRRNLLLFISGALGVFLFSPFDLWPLLFLLLPVFFGVLDAAYSARRAAWDGFFFGYGFFMAGTYWIAISLTVEADKFAWLIPFSLFGLSACFAVYFLLLGWCYHRLKTKAPVANAFLFAALWVCVEYLRSIGIFGFPWNLIGYSVVQVPFLLRYASVAGIFGLSLLVMVMVMGVSPWLQGSCGKRYKRIYIISLLAVVAALLAYSAYDDTRIVTGGKSLRIRIVQPNIPQSMKWQPEQMQTVLRTLGSYTQISSKAPPPDIVVWPETAVPFALHEYSEWPERVGAWLPEHAMLVTGVVTDTVQGYSNALIVVDHEGVIKGRYDKRQLVPFGEFVPLRRFLPVDKITAGAVDFIRGKEALPIAVQQDSRFLPLICYESAFPWLASTEGKYPDWLLVVTNDAWFGNSPGPYQHFTMSRVRAVEQGVPVVRSANTGMSAMIDANGRVVKKMSLNKQGVIDVALAKPKSRTIYAYVGERLNGVLLLIILLLVLRYAWATKN